MSAYARTRVKICGLTRPEDVAAAVRSGADAIGLVFYEQSSRALTIAQAQSLRSAVPAFVDVVALFVNANPDYVRQVIEHVQPDLLQFHGDESPEYCQSFKRRYFRGFRVGAPGLDTAAGVLQSCRAYMSASAWLVDSYSPHYGGSGVKLNVDLLAAVRAALDSRPLILAGGLTPESVADSMAAVHPYAVDVSSGVETAPGIKSDVKIKAFIRAVNAAGF
ncbi:MAG TPA: phosphoribosylanthranilate isomerase [Candidimonas sp.]|nr:phosphoribosylanthranilate isomerase [Candidimonas sp.]